jgi:hypothetical protein
MTFFACHIRRALAVVGLALLGLGATALPAAAASLPTAVTGPVSAVSYTSATFSGNANPNGLASTWYFQYGTSTSYGIDSPAHSGGSGTATFGVSEPVSGLTPGTTYHFRLVVKSSAGTSVGGDQSFKTAIESPSVTLSSPTSVTDTSFTVRASLNAHGLVTIWYVAYGTTTAYNLRSASANAGSSTSAVSVSVALKGLSPGTRYYYEIVANSAAGQSLSGGASATTSGPPSVQVNAITGQGATSATLNGAVNPDGHATSWYFQYGTSTQYGEKTATHSAGSGTSPVTVTENVSGLAPQATYHYRLVATNASGTVTSPDQTMTTPGPTISSGSSMTTYRHSVRLSGWIPAPANSTVTLFAERYDQGSFVLIGTVLSDANGNWSYTVNPAVQTTYKAIWNGISSPATSINVRPAVSLRLIKGRFLTHLAGSRSFGGRVAQLQQLERRGWVTVSRTKLNRASSGSFAPKLGHGTLHLRVAVADNQTGNGYAAGYSYTMTYRH